jgi:hypothetical protein
VKILKMMAAGRRAGTGAVTPKLEGASPTSNPALEVDSVRAHRLTARCIGTVVRLPLAAGAISCGRRCVAGTVNHSAVMMKGGNAGVPYRRPDAIALKTGPSYLLCSTSLAPPLAHGRYLRVRRQLQQAFLIRCWTPFQASAKTAAGLTLASFRQHETPCSLSS